MHAAVWSQPTVSHKLLRRVHSDVDPPVTTSEKIVLGAGIAITLLGGLLTVLGLTGYFILDEAKFYIGFGALSGVFALLAGLTAVRIVGRRSLTLRQFVLFLVLALLSAASALVMVILGAFLLRREDIVVLISVIAVCEIASAAVVIVLSTAGLSAGLYSRKDFLDSCSRPTDLGRTPPEDPVSRYRPSLLASESTSPDTTVSPVSDPEG